MLRTRALSVPNRNYRIGRSDHHAIAHEPGAFSVLVPVRKILREFNAVGRRILAREPVNASRPARDDVRWTHAAL